VVTLARAAFAANWLVTSRWLKQGHGAQGSATQLGLGELRFLSLVVRPPAPIADGLAEAASALAGVQPEHYLYPPASLHLTVLDLADRPGAQGEVAAVVARRRRFAIEVLGLNVSAGTVFAELYPSGSELRGLRRELRALQSSEHGPISRWFRRRLAHVNLMRFAAPVDPRLLAGIAELRGRDFGSFEVGELELARADKVMSAATRTVGVYRLGGTPPTRQRHGGSSPAGNS
jgi:2'-5' RNA ligase